MITQTPHVLALAGGVGGSKLALGLSRILPPSQLTIIVNTGDDEIFHGLHVSPDLDTVMYTLSNLSDTVKGWGIANDTFAVLGALERYGAPNWFNLGDMDFATHIQRTHLLKKGLTLSQVTRDLCQRLDVHHLIAPMSDQPVRTIAITDEGPMPFQNYFVQRRCEPKLQSVRFDGAASATPSPDFQRALETATALVYCPSNPIVSIGPILEVNSVRASIESFRGPRVAVSPIIGGQAFRGPAAKMLAELGEEISCVGIARRLTGLCDTLIIDHVDANRALDVQMIGLDPYVTNTIMENNNEKERLAHEICEYLDVL
jgi:LPPG:FO 2-phospho-L-lactate transferase